MKLVQRKFLAMPLVGLALILAGCVSGQYNKIKQVSTENSLLRFYGKTQKNLNPRRVAFASPWEYEEYAGFTNKKERLELFYVSATDDDISLDYEYSIQVMVDTWLYNAGKSKSWGEAYHVKNSTVLIDYKRYTQNDEPCAGFHVMWDKRIDDPNMRPGRVVFGYLCKGPGNQLTDAEIADTLGNIGFKALLNEIRLTGSGRITAQFGEKSNISQEQRSTALAIARGATPDISGNHHFPFNFAITYDAMSDSGPLVDN